MSLTINRLSKPVDPPLQLKQITEGEVFIFTNEPGTPGGGQLETPAMVSDEESYIYLDSGVIHSITGTVGNRSVKRIACEFTW